MNRLTPAEVIAMRDKLARVGWNDACADGLCPSFCHHRLIKCTECGIEWGWGGDLEKLEQMRDEHNAKEHSDDY